MKLVLEESQSGCGFPLYTKIFLTLYDSYKIGGGILFGNLFGRFIYRVNFLDYFYLSIFNFIFYDRQQRS